MSATVNSEQLGEYLPKVRCTPTMKRKLEEIAAQSVTRNISDHIRFALEQYIEEQEKKLTTS